MNFIIVMDAGCQIIARYQMMRSIAIRDRILSCSDKFKQNFNIRFLIKNSFIHASTTFFIIIPQKENNRNLISKLRLFFGGELGIRLSHCGARSGAALDVPRTSIHSRAASNPYPLSLKQKAPSQGRCFLLGGELGIRTLGEFPHTAFRVLHLRPLGQLSVYC